MLNGNCLLLSPLHSNLFSCRTQTYSTFPCCLYCHHSFLIHSLPAYFITPSFKNLVFGWSGFVSLNVSFYPYFVLSHASDMSVYIAVHNEVYTVTRFHHYLPILNLVCIFQSLKYLRYHYISVWILNGIHRIYMRWDLGCYCLNSWNITNSSVHYSHFLYLDLFLFW